MQQSFRKLKRVKPIIKLKQTRVDSEAELLSRIRDEKIAVVKTMKESQKKYMDGVDQLNQLRTSKDRSNLTTFESAIDHVKEQWWQLYRKVQEIERREKAQMNQLLIAERELKSIEKLREQYESEFQAETKRIEQKNVDELALRKFTVR